MEQAVVLLAIDRRALSRAAREAFALSRAELAILSRKARAAGADVEVAVLVNEERFEIYTTRSARRTVYRALLGAIVERLPGDERSRIRTTEALGVAAAWHLMHVMTGTERRSGVRLLADLGDALARARDAGTLGFELAELLESAANAGWRIQSETRLGDGECSTAEQQLDWFEAERIIDEELVGWQASRASHGSRRSVPLRRLDSSYYTAAETGSSVRLRAQVPGAKPLRGDARAK